MIFSVSGPGKLFELQQQVTAIRLSASESAIGTGPATPRNPDCMKFGHFDEEGKCDTETYAKVLFVKMLSPDVNTLIVLLLKEGRMSETTYNSVPPTTAYPHSTTLLF